MHVTTSANGDGKIVGQVTQGGFVFVGIGNTGGAALCMDVSEARALAATLLETADKADAQIKAAA